MHVRLDILDIWAGVQQDQYPEKSINHLWCSDCSENRLDIKFDTLALTLMVTAWEKYYKRVIAGNFLSLC